MGAETESQEVAWPDDSPATGDDLVQMTDIRQPADVPPDDVLPTDEDEVWSDIGYGWDDDFPELDWDEDGGDPGDYYDPYGRGEAA